ncbi:MAG: chemotaxis protein CheW [Oculatellaceae cyanobacterium Prado106]|nr:chemotaxis protein CheW [Oculatellaceae cyanobacterium Prado106]
MLWLLLSIEGERYAIESGDVVEILPWVKLQTLHQAPATIAGLLNDRDRPIPIVSISANCSMVAPVDCMFVPGSFW